MSRGAELRGRSGTRTVLQVQDLPFQNPNGGRTAAEDRRCPTAPPGDGRPGREGRLPLDQEVCRAEEDDAHARVHAHLSKDKWVRPASPHGNDLLGGCLVCDPDTFSRPDTAILPRDQSVVNALVRGFPTTGDGFGR